MLDHSMKISNVKIILEDGISLQGDLFIQNGKIQEIAEKLEQKADLVLDGTGKNWTLVPGFIDLHIHGAAGHDVMDATKEALAGMAQTLPKEGTTSFLATTITQSKEAITKALMMAGHYMNEQPDHGQAEILGIHLEGPFISSKKAGAQPLEHIIAPNAVLFDQWQKASGEKIRLVTAAPETDGGQAFFKYAADQHVVASIGHSNATSAEVKEAINQGARHITHLFNQMSGLHHREPGVVGAAFLHNELIIEMIVDFVHIHPEAVKLAYSIKGADRTILITDAMRAKGLPDGTYDLGGQEVFVAGNEARLKDGTLAGSILTFQDAIKNMKSQTNLSMEELVKITSSNAAKQIGVYDRKGSITVGKDADLVLLDQKWTVQHTICRGKISYQKEELFQ
ncbi:N-acetylglucosamine-6-phosphate deacetylase [Jeotgalibacillus soli]|uniref:N-acetylglucosamine-6-phosphate deacetylase n=1 Tax=Jeotgalibacillus soli TaxID=889306 RepID=A0A0C2S697_9BACL|nr:N-acetylglucosamine-6-phosphate deacetylase [Jeotgalibacillus soli]KIL49534.1 N-acetylglucosamine-6-phosphate deacetylase [Jeotgalibacillus soli]